MSKVSTKNMSNGYENLVIEPKKYELKPSDPRFTFKNFYIEYGRFHQHAHNVAIHLVGIPAIMFSVNGLLQSYNYSLILDLNDGVKCNLIQGDNTVHLSAPNTHYIDPVMVFWITLSLLYLYVEVVVGIATFIVGIFVYIPSNYIIDLDNKENSIFYKKSWTFFVGI